MEDMEKHIKKVEDIYLSLNSTLVDYYNEPYNYSKLVALMGSSFSKLLSTDFIEKVFKAKQKLHKIEKKITLDNITIEFINSKLSVYEFKERRKHRAEAIKSGIQTESGIEAHISFKMTDYFCDFETLSAYKNAITGLHEFFLKENRNLEGLLSQGKALAYNGIRFSDETNLFGYETEEDIRNSKAK